MKKFIPLLFAWSFVLNIYVANIGQLLLKALVIPSLAVTIFSLLFSWVFIKALKHHAKGQIFGSIFFILFFSYGETLVVLKHIGAHILSGQIEYFLLISF